MQITATLRKARELRLHVQGASKKPSQSMKKKSSVLPVTPCLQFVESYLTNFLHGILLLNIDTLLQNGKKSAKIYVCCIFSWHATTEGIAYINIIGRLQKYVENLETKV